MKSAAGETITASGVKRWKEQYGRRYYCMIYRIKQAALRRAGLLKFKKGGEINGNFVYGRRNGH